MDKPGVPEERLNFEPVDDSYPPDRTDADGGWWVTLYDNHGLSIVTEWVEDIHEPIRVRQMPTGYVATHVGISHGGQDNELLRAPLGTTAIVSGYDRLELSLSFDPHTEHVLGMT